MNFEPANCRRFRFTEVSFDEAASSAYLRYAIDDRYCFTETFTFPGAAVPETAEGRAALKRALHLLHLAAGVSYFKAAVPPEISVENRKLSARTAAFFERLYLGGLAEFSYRNDLTLDGRLRFPAEALSDDPPVPCPLRRRTAVPLGGGKDSLVVLEALLAAGEEVLPIAVGEHHAIRSVAERSGLPLTVIERRVDPLLLELNSQGAYNGHVPISAIIAFSMLAAAILYGFDAVAIAQERSANTGNLIREGRNVNHQYSKSLEFENDFRSLLTGVLPSLDYFSFLRPLSELSICRLFSMRCRKYFEVFTSCNKAFRMHGAMQGWCGECPKCRFVFLGLAPFLERAALLSIFKRNPLDEIQQLRGYAELLGIEGHRPLECVGEVEECRGAFSLLLLKPEWQGDVLVRHFKPFCEKSWVEASERALAPSMEHNLPPRFWAMLDAFS